MQTVLGFAVLDKVDMPVVATTGAWGAVLEQGGHARCFDDRCIWFYTIENCGGSAVAGMVDVCWRSSSTVVNVPVLMQRRCFSCSSWTRSLTCPLCPTTGVHGGAAGAVPVVVDVPVIKQRQVGVATMLHMAVLAAMKYGGLDWRWRGFFGGIDAIFPAPPVVTELSASFRALEHLHM